MQPDSHLRSRTGRTPATGVVAPATRNRRRNGFAIVLFPWLLAFLAPSASFSQPAPTPVTTLRVYRAIDSRRLGGSLGDAGTHLGNTNGGSAGGVLGYLHSEVIPSFAVPNTGRRSHDIDAIAVFEVRFLNVRRARLVPSNDSPGEANLFGPYMAFDRGMAMPPLARDQILRYGAYVGIQEQNHNPRHAYPGSWYSFVGRCPLSPWGSGEDSLSGKPSPCPTTPALENICPATSAAPDGSALCQYTYTYLGYVPLDDLVGITSKTHPLCATNGKSRACVDYADFRRNGGIEYESGTTDAVECASKTVPESGLPFWSGRCDSEKDLARMRALTNWPHLIVPKQTAK